MVTTLLTSLATNGLANLASSIFDAFTDKGEEKVKELLKEHLGIDIDFNEVLTESDIALFKHKEAILLQSLDTLRENNKHKEFLITKDIESEQMVFEDIQDAREANKTYVNSQSSITANFLPIFSTIILALVFWNIYHILGMVITPDNERIVYMLLEFDKALALITVSFWLGSSFGSKLKDINTNNINKLKGV